MTRHPGGEAHTTRMLALAGVKPPCRILDLGAGDGETVRQLRCLGFDAWGIDLAPGHDVEHGDILNASFSDEEFDALITQCTFYVTGDPQKAFRESQRLLRPGGRLLFSDVSFGGQVTLRAAAESAGLTVLIMEDLTKIWREYYIESIWNGTAYAMPCGCAKGKCTYWLMICERDVKDGSVR
ncbi:class I SAM-dependent methyltransferase [Oscillospiraceae bacterium LTW-04]|nr:class I SAM-dependent methyltransferase [Oscillospiraceae bacterium MB24-C1]